MTQHPARLLFTTAALLVISGCATRQPVLYPNQHMKDVGEAQAQSDTAACVQLATDSGLSGGAGGRAAERAAEGAVIGGASGAAAGAVWGRAGRHAGARAAGSATSGFLSALIRSDEPDQATRRFIEECLREKGYKPIGWR